MIYYRKEFSIQASLDLTRPAKYRDVMLHRKLVSEEVTVLDLWINHRGDRQKSGKLCHTVLLHSRYADFWRIHQRGRMKRKVGAVRAGSLERCAAGEWQVCWVEGWLRRVLWQERGGKREGDREKTLFYSTHLQLWTHYSCSVTSPLKFHFSNNTLKVASVSTERIFDYHYKRRR